MKQYLIERRSALSVTLEEPGPNETDIGELVQIASRVPDHGKLAPWRFVVLERKARERLHARFVELLEKRTDLPEREKKRASTGKLLHGPSLIMVVSTAREHPKIPIWEQQLSAGAACMNMLVAANALGFEAQWLTAWYVYEREGRQMLGLDDHERVAGFIHIGSSSAAKSERDRPDIGKILTTIEE